MDPISAIIAMIASAALQSYSADQAASRTQAAAREAQQRQLDAQNQATQLAAQRANDFDANTRNTKQGEIAQQLTQQYDQAAQPMVTAQGVQVGQTLPTGAGGDDYQVAKAKEQAKTAASLHALAGLFGRVGAAGQLRQNEAIGIVDTANAIGQVKTGADNIGKIDQVGIKAAGIPDLASQIGAAALNAYGMNQLATAGLPKAPTPSTGTGINLRGPSGTGLRAPSTLSWLT